jgi:general secretion pathway protein E
MNKPNRTEQFASESRREVSAFTRELSEKGYLEDSALGGAELESVGGATLRDLWGSTVLPAHEFAEEVASFFGLRRATLSELMGARSLTERFSPRFLRDSGVFPFQTSGGAVALAVGDPTDADALRAAAIVFDGPIEVVAASFEDIATVLGDRLDADGSDATVARADAAGGEESIDNLRDLAIGAPVVRAVNDLMEKAIELRASDIHIEPFRDGLTVRLRVDGLLRPIASPSHVPPQALISRIKILAGLNIAERRLPQDGAARLEAARTEIDIRVATMPTQHGESAVIRLLPRDRGLLDVPKLGLSAPDEKTLRRLLELPHGLIAVTGPTGSGKTTTLATMLATLNSPTRKILTIEDPVEYEIVGINQTQVKPAIGLSFASAMRAFVRQDPDVIMVGEVRDGETASIAIHAALTGHLVLTTLHTETSTAAPARLIDLGVEPFLLKSTLRAVIAQRLVRVLCDRCKVSRGMSVADREADPRLETLGLRAGETLYHPKGCESCGGVGYRGRVGVFEVLQVAGEVRDLIRADVDSGGLDAAATRAGMTTMIDDAVAKCRNGTTSVAEALRVTTVR